jgi:hypothetical protein
MSLSAALAASLILTLVLEMGLFLLLRGRDKKDALLLVMVNLLTNPPVVLLFWLSQMYTDIAPALVQLPLEAAAVFIEGRCYKKFGRAVRRPYLLSLALNAFSYGAGLVIQTLF